MRFRGGGIGHKSTQERTQVFAQQSHILPWEDEEALVVDSVDSEQETESEESNDEMEDEECQLEEVLADEMGGGEDGEEPWDEDELEAEGYAQL